MSDWDSILSSSFYSPNKVGLGPEQHLYDRTRFVDTVAVLPFVDLVFLGQCILGNACQAVVAIRGSLKPVMGRVSSTSWMPSWDQDMGNLCNSFMICFDSKWHSVLIRGNDHKRFPKTMCLAIMLLFLVLVLWLGLVQTLERCLGTFRCLGTLGCLLHLGLLRLFLHHVVVLGITWPFTKTHYVYYGTWFSIHLKRGGWRYPSVQHGKLVFLQFGDLSLDFVGTMWGHACCNFQPIIETYNKTLPMVYLAATTGGSHSNRLVAKGPNHSGFLMGCVLTDVTDGTTALVEPLIPINPKASCNVDPPDSWGLGLNSRR